MKPTPEDFRKFAKDKQRCENYKLLAYDAWIVFKTINPESELFKTQIDLVDTYLGILHSVYDFTPEWIKEYHTRRILYWNPMKVRLFNEIDPVDYDLSINFNFKHKNVECEFILN